MGRGLSGIGQNEDQVRVAVDGCADRTASKAAQQKTRIAQGALIFFAPRSSVLTDSGVRENGMKIRICVMDQVTGKPRWDYREGDVLPSFMFGEDFALHLEENVGIFGVFRVTHLATGFKVPAEDGERMAAVKKARRVLHDKGEVELRAFLVKAREFLVLNGLVEA
jgi:hypothetical protein